MTAHYLTIEERHETPGHVSLANFSVARADAVNPDVVCANASISLYCLDDAGKQAIFVELPPDIDLAKAPFVYQTQVKEALRLVAMPYATFLQVAQQLPSVQRLIMIYMTGRCGSTLLSQLLNEVDSVLSLSEPDVATQFVRLRPPGGTRDTELHALLDATVRCLFKPTAFKTATTYALKLKNEGTQLMDLYQATFPTVKNLFLYRDAIGFVQSFYRLFRTTVPEVLPVSAWMMAGRQHIGTDLTPLTTYVDEGTTELSIPQFLALWWLAVIEWYLAQHARGIPALAVRYDDLNAHRERVVSEVFTYCGLPSGRVQEALGVFERDAQSGTPQARENPKEGNTLKLSNVQRNDVIKILQRHPAVTEADFIVPGTLQV